jgi:hypothetical protein
MKTTLAQEPKRWEETAKPDTKNGHAVVSKLRITV